MQQIPQETIEKVLASTDIVRLIGAHLQLERMGAAFKAKCPFHHEKTPSFTVSPTRQTFHCFGCGKHGNAIGFIMEYESLSFPDAVRKLAAGANLSMMEVSDFPTHPETMPTPFHIRPLRPDEWDEVAALIHHSTNSWYRINLNREIFGPDPLACRVFPEIYEALDPGCCLVAEDATGKLVGSCFYHPRETHWSLGIMNAIPESRGAANALLREITRLADDAGLPLRLVSSACNLDSFSLYSKAGFVPVRIYQDMILSVPETGMDPASAPALISSVRPATMDDLPAIVALEEEISGIRREKDHRFFIENGQGVWTTLVIDGADGLDGFLTSIAHPGSRMLGPGVSRDTATALALLWSQLDRTHRGSTPVWLAPADATELVHTCYGWGAKNCELHLAQTRGGSQRHSGFIFPTFMPETA
ncbi:CHC2 zinc finger domain-containing protein [Luteolibacter sp. SL250]|uniref:GNAT family N-acetyltransferase n=1 Tax=Luteolibacter sp. SL250 TaxID=2995170 RepID=UPI00227055AD|nr:CHC2 zinc finger domain-containing protein [Luteolibacter sp. SL250]WAC19797.1 CHC2 zinc finger domain-containing protein [Luteolibacter sp. SL250]